MSKIKCTPLVKISGGLLNLNHVSHGYVDTKTNPGKFIATVFFTNGKQLTWTFNTKPEAQARLDEIVAAPEMELIEEMPV